MFGRCYEALLKLPARATTVMPLNCGCDLSTVAVTEIVTEAAAVAVTVCAVTVL